MDEDYLRKLAKQDPDASIKLSLKLVDDLKNALERLNQNPGNSSRPSGSQAPWDKGQSEDDEELESHGEDPHQPSSDHGDDEHNSSQSDENENPDTTMPMKPGRQEGAQGFGRTQKLATTDIEPHYCGRCQGCGFDLHDVEVATTGFYSIDVIFGDSLSPGIKVSNTLHRYYRASCPECGLISQTMPQRAAPDNDSWENVGLTQWRLIGPALAALIVYLSMDMRLSNRQIKRFLDDLLSLELSVGSIQNCMIESARALAPVEEQLVNELLSTDLMHADETSHPEGTLSLWLWVFINAKTAVFLIGGRHKEMFHNLLESGQIAFNGWLMSDGYGVYRDYAKRLRCWAHIRRKAIGLSECYTQASRAYGEHVLDIMEVLMQAIYQAREGPDKGTASIRDTHQSSLNELYALARIMAQSSHEKTRQLGVELLNDWQAFFRILDTPCWPLTNNEAERALRHWVILRRITYGTRSEQGSRALALFASVITTCRLRGCSPLLFVRDVIKARRDGFEVPMLPMG